MIMMNQMISIQLHPHNKKIFSMVSNDLIKQKDNFILLKNLFNINDHLNRDEDFIFTKKK